MSRNTVENSGAGPSKLWNQNWSILICSNFYSRFQILHTYFYCILLKTDISSSFIFEENIDDKNPWVLLKMSSQNYRNGVQEWDEKLAQCPYYPSHQIRPTRFGHHLLQCRSFLVSKLLTFRSALLFMWQVRKCKALEAYFFLFSALCLPIFFFHTKAFEIITR